MNNKPTFTAGGATVLAITAILFTLVILQYNQHSDTIDSNERIITKLQDDINNLQDQLLYERSERIKSSLDAKYLAGCLMGNAYEIDIGSVTKGLQNAEELIKGLAGQGE